MNADTKLKLKVIRNNTKSGVVLNATFSDINGKVVLQNKIEVVSEGGNESERENIISKFVYHINQAARQILDDKNSAGTNDQFLD